MAEYNPSKIIKDGNTYNFRDTTKIPLAGSNAISGDLIPSTDGTVNLGSPSYQWNNAYIKSLTINGVACGDILTHNASEFVDVTSAQTIGGNKTFSGNTKFTSTATIEKSTGDVELLIKNPAVDSTSVSANAVDDIRFTDSSDRITGSMRISYDTSNGVTAMLYARSYSADGSVNSTNGISITSNQQTGAARATISANLLPNSTGTYDLGTSTNKWKSLNGINPGALSLPSNSYINIDTTNWDLTCSNRLLGSFTPTADGWLMLQVNNSGSNEVNFWIIGGTLKINNKSTINTVNNNNFNIFTIPVRKGTQYNIYGMPSEYVAGRSIAYCRFMPCQGNV